MERCKDRLQWTCVEALLRQSDGLRWLNDLCGWGQWWMFLYLDFRMAFDTVSHSVSSGPEEGWLKWLDCLVVWTGWITGLRWIAQCSFVRRLKVEYSVKWYWGWCSVSLQRTPIIRQCSSIREGVNMLKDRAWVHDLADRNLIQFDKKCRILSFAERNPGSYSGMCWTWVNSEFTT